MKRGVIVSVMCALFLTFGCAPTATWVSRPLVQTGENANFKTEIEPLKMEYTFYVAFKLVVTNKTDKPMEVDWAKTTYLHDGKAEGTFAFKGMRAKEAKTPPPDVVAAGATLTKVICPLSLIAYARLLDTSVDPGERGISCGMLPQGENGVRLVIRQDGREMEENLAVKIGRGDGR